MITALIAGAVMGMTPAELVQDGQKKSPGTLISEMFAKYHKANSLSATIETTTLAGSDKSVISTHLQYLRPGMLYIKQTSPSALAMAVCDGNYLAYTRPLDPTLTQVRDRVFGELAFNPDLSRMNVWEAYTAMSLSLIDRSAPLDILIGRVEDLGYVKDQWATLTDKGTVDFNGVKARRLGGDWRPYGNSDKILGAYEIVIAEETADLLQFRYVENIFDPASRKTVQTVTTWDVKATVNGAVDDKLFDSKLVKG